MRAQRGRVKKLTLAFRYHWQSGSGWRCEECRAHRLEETRKCGLLGMKAKDGDPPVWAKGDLVLQACPKPQIRGASVSYLLAYAAARQTAAIYAHEMSAKCLDAFRLLDKLVQEDAAETRAAEARRGS